MQYPKKKDIIKVKPPNLFYINKNYHEIVLFCKEYEFITFVKYF